MNSKRAHRPSNVDEAVSVTPRRRAPSLAPGGQIGRYVLQDKLGQGTFGLIFTARDTVLDRAVAIKILNPAHQYNADLLRRFLQEALASARVVHPGIVTVHDFGTMPTSLGETAYIVLELLQGESLTSRLERTGRFQIPWAIEIGRQVASALDCAHRAGVLHRDLKSENIYLVPDPAAVNGERVKVLDFGLAKLGPSQHTQMNTVFGTPRYMSPEQCRSATSIDERSDIYSLGCILFELLTGRTPFSGDLRQQLEAHKRANAPRASSLNPEIPPALDDLIARTLAKDPNARPQTMADLQTTFYALNAAELARPSNPNIPIPMPVAVTPVSPGVAATILPTAASMLAMQARPPAPQPISPARLAQRAVEFSSMAPTASAALAMPAQRPVINPATSAAMTAAMPAAMPLPLPRPARPTPQVAPLPPPALIPLPALVVAPPADYHLAPHLPSLKKQPVRASIAGAAIAFLIAALLTAVAARGHMKSASASPEQPSVPASTN